MTNDQPTERPYGQWLRAAGRGTGGTAERIIDAVGIGRNDNQRGGDHGKEVLGMEGYPNRVKEVGSGRKQNGKLQTEGHGENMQLADLSNTFQNQNQAFLDSAMHADKEGLEVAEVKRRRTENQHMQPHMDREDGETVMEESEENITRDLPSRPARLNELPNLELSGGVGNT